MLSDCVAGTAVLREGPGSARLVRCRSLSLSILGGHGELLAQVNRGERWRIRQCDGVGMLAGSPPSCLKVAAQCWPWLTWPLLARQDWQRIRVRHPQPVPPLCLCQQPGRRR